MKHPSRQHTTRRIARVLLALPLLAGLTFGVASPTTLQAQTGPYLQKTKHANARTGKRPWLGVQLRTTAQGVSIQRVLPNTPAQRAGLRAGDRILRIGTTAIHTGASLQKVMASRKVGQYILLTYARGTAPPRTISMRLDAIPANLTARATPAGANTSAQLGRQVSDYPLTHLKHDNTSAASSLRAFKGKPVVIMFWATWCPACKRMFPSLEALKQRHGEDVHVITISNQKSAVIQQYMDRTGWDTLTFLRDPGGRAHRHFGVRAIPRIVVLDRDQKLRKVFRGYTPAKTLSATLLSL